MSRAIYIFPFLMDCVVGLVLFVNPVRAAQMGCSDFVITGLVAIWAASYVLTCTVISRILTKRNAAMLTSVACAVMCVTSILFSVAPGIKAMTALMALAGAGCGMFFPPFQIFMKAVDTGQNRSAASSTGWYTFSWSSGLAIGPFLSGFLMQLGDNGWIYAFRSGAMISLAAACGVWLLRQYAVRQDGQATSEDDNSVQLSGHSFQNAPDLAWLGWIGTGLGCAVLSMGRSLFPAMASKELHLAAGLQGSVFFLIGITQAIVGLFLCRASAIMYRSKAVLLFGLAGVIGISSFGLRIGGPWVFCAGAVFLGTYSGFMFFYLVFHSLTHPSKSARYISINEIIVGLSAVVGPLLAGLMAKTSNSYVLPYFLGAGIIAATVIFQAIVHRIRPLET